MLQALHIIIVHNATVTMAHYGKLRKTIWHTVRKCQDVQAANRTCGWKKYAAEWGTGGVVVLGGWVTVAITFLPRIETDLWDGDSIARHQRVTENIDLRTETSPSPR